MIDEKKLVEEIRLAFSTIKENIEILAKSGNVNIDLEIGTDKKTVPLSAVKIFEVEVKATRQEEF